jgi:bla regulator protein BlaR1
LLTWFVGCSGHLVAWWLRWRRFAAIARVGAPIEEGRELAALRRVQPLVGARQRLAFLSCDTSCEPGVFGILRPVLLWPESIGERLTDAQLETVLAHELCHIRRRDNLTAAVHMFVEAMFWFHPLVWWLEKRMVDERERACDEAVIRLGGEPQSYAESILKTCEFYVESPSIVAGVTGSDLKKRVETIITNRMTDTLNVRKKLFLASVGMVAVAGPVIIGLLDGSQIQAQTQATQSQATGRSPEPLTIEVASIKRNNSDRPGPQFRPQSGGFSAEGITLQLLVEMAYGIQQFQISGAPAWMSTDRFDITLKVDGVTGPLPQDRWSSALQSLLTDRFRLKIHRDTKEGPIYALTAGSRGPKLQIAAGVRPLMMSARNGYISGTTDLTVLGDVLAWRLERPVLNKTGLSGVYDIELIWTPDVGQLTGNSLPPPPPPPPPAKTARGNMPLLPMRTAPAPDPSGPSLFVAVQEQLGLKLESTRGPVEVLVIDSVERPTPD